MEAKKVNPEKIKSGNINLRRKLGDLSELANDIRKRHQQGKEAIIHELLVREINDEIYDYEIIDGKRRLQSALSIRLPEVPIKIVKETDPRELEMLSYLSNEFRKDNTWMEKAEFFKRKHDRGETLKEIGVDVGLSESRVSTYISTYERWIGLKLSAPQVLEMDTTLEIVNKCPEEDIPELIEFVIKNKVSSKDLRKILFALRNFYASLETLKDFYPELHAELVSVYYPHRFNPKAISLYEQEELLRTGRAKPIVRFLDIKDFPTTNSVKEYACKYNVKIINKISRSGWQVTMIPHTKAEIRHKLKKLVEQT